MIKKNIISALTCIAIICLLITVNFSIKSIFAIQDEDDETESVANAEYCAVDEYFTNTQEGLLVSFNNGTSYTYPNVIDLDNFIKDTSSLIDFYVLPYKQGTADFISLDVILIDAYDENNYVTVNFIHNPEDYGMCYVKAQSSVQSGMVGVQWWAEDNTIIWKNNQYGYMGKLGFTGDINKNGPKKYDVMDFNLCFNNKTKSFYGDHAWYTYGDKGSRFITCLTDLNLYDKQFWKRYKHK